ncbi:hypothetical protein JCM30471_21800 [Desulfuromonas carbonis]|uniref:DUF3185 domain-containing protein n=1 Tax=Desulfuromonas sp. DDH964 TaxID=1823759 RepID=UPI00078B4E02|nr:DUF3185 domain-containing protein [Desulfuromonas sp. DDH964]AMV73761.1 hypothetical protein DBW_3463 [Desulfuromonas sp. DDH964]
MKPYMLTAILLIVAAVAAFAYQGRALITRETLEDFRMMAQATSAHQLLPVLGILALANGIGLLVKGRGWSRLRERRDGCTVPRETSTERAA